MSGVNNFGDFNLNEVIEYLRRRRETVQRCGREILDLWDFIKENIYKAGKEKHVIFEQVFFAALDFHCYDMAKSCINQLEHDFPNSLRVLKLKAMLLEAAEKYGSSKSIIDSIIAVDENHAPARKRCVAILKAQGQIPEAIKELVLYLKRYISDLEGWMELSELYLQVQEYAAAAFCVEELILHQPHNHLLYQRLADIRYTMGGGENMEMAKTYYCQALKLNPDNMRALLALFLTSNNLLNQYKSSGSAKRREAWQLAHWAQAQITKKKEAAASTSAPLAEMMLALSITD